MTEETNTKNSKAVIIRRRFCGFLLLYFCFFYLLFSSLNGVLSIIDYTLIFGLHYYLGRLFLIMTGFVAVWLVFPIFFISRLSQKDPFVCEPSKISFFHLLTLIISFTVCFIMYAVSLFLDVSGINTNLAADDVVELQLLFLILLSVFCISLSLKSTFRKRIFMKKR